MFSIGSKTAEAQDIAVCLLNLLLVLLLILPALPIRLTSWQCVTQSSYIKKMFVLILLFLLTSTFIVYI